MAEQHAFKAEIQQLLDILIHSLYTDRDIFLRELVSNASDALSRLQFEQLTNPNVVDPEAELLIELQPDMEAKTLTVTDSGIGMTQEAKIGHYFKRLTMIENSFGDTDFHLRRVTDAGGLV